MEDSILLVSLPPWGVEVPPLGLASLSAYLNSQKINNEIFDFNVELYNLVDDKCHYLWQMSYADYWHSPQEYPAIYEKLKREFQYLANILVFSPEKFIGFSLPTNCSNFVVADLARIIKKRTEKTVVVGGSSVSIYQQRLNLVTVAGEFIDYYIVGEGEEALAELLRSKINNQNPAPRVKAVLSQNDAKNDIDLKDDSFDFSKLPLIDFLGFDLDKYKLKQGFAIEFSRGCRGNCPFCSFAASVKFKVRHYKDIAKHVSFYDNKYNIKHLRVVDSAINNNSYNLEKACDLLIKNKNKIKLTALAIPNETMNYKLLKKMKKAGFYRLEYGVESGSNKILKLMRKSFTSQIAARVIRDTYLSGIDVYIYLITGYIQETEDDLQQTKLFLRRNKNFITAIKSINPLYIMSGSRLDIDAVNYGVKYTGQGRDRYWYIPGENDYNIRKARVVELKQYVRHLGIPLSEQTDTLDFITG
jgi:radical SAM superfamily enzyme YgiQ (UPF0313 family)